MDFRSGNYYLTFRNMGRKSEKALKRIVNLKKFESGERLIRSLREKYKTDNENRRCFIIGNGPSLTVKDLDTLKEHKEICIASNSIYNLFGQTDWRPDIYTVHDFQEIKKTHEKIAAVKSELKIAAQSAEGRIYDIDGAITLRLIEPEESREKVFFSDDISKCIYDGGTVTYVSMQCAVYLGFREIILLGVDHSFAREIRKDGTVEINNRNKNHFTNYQTNDFWGNNMSDEEAVVFPVDFATLAFETAKQYADAYGIKILNATRGGKLEVFERVNFDSLW